MTITHQQALDKLDRVDSDFKYLRDKITKLTKGLNFPEELTILRKELVEKEELWKNTEQDYLERIEELLRPRKGGGTREEGDNEDNEELTAELDQLKRDKGELELETVDLSNKLKLKQQEVNRKEESIEQLKKEKGEIDKNLNKKITEKNGLITTLNKEKIELKKKVEQLETTAKMVDIWIEPIKIEGQERSETKGIMTELFFDLTITVSPRGEKRNEGPHIIGDAWNAFGLINTYSEDKDNNPGSLVGKKVKTVIIPNAGNSKKVWVGDKFTKSDRNTKQVIKITGPFDNYDENTLTLTFKPDNVELEGILTAHSL